LLSQLNGDTRSRECLGFALRHRPDGFEAECDGLEDSPYARTIGIASHRAPGLHDKAGDKLQGQAASGAALLGYPSKRDLHFFEELLPL
jgi:hypothetical protein